MAQSALGQIPLSVSVCLPHFHICVEINLLPFEIWSSTLHLSSQCISTVFLGCPTSRSSSLLPAHSSSKKKPKKRILLHHQNATETVTDEGALWLFSACDYSRDTSVKTCERPVLVRISVWCRVTLGKGSDAKCDASWAAPLQIRVCVKSWCVVSPRCYFKPAFAFVWGNLSE